MSQKKALPSLADFERFGIVAHDSNPINLRYSRHQVGSLGWSEPAMIASATSRVV